MLLGTGDSHQERTQCTPRTSQPGDLFAVATPLKPKLHNYLILTDKCFLCLKYQ